MDKRHQRRIRLVEKLFAYGFDPAKKEPFVRPILDNLQTIDKMITEHATRYPIDKISKIDLAILRLSIYELIVEKKNPEKVIIDEAVILAKELGNEKSYAFINGVLGSILKSSK